MNGVYSVVTEFVENGLISKRRPKLWENQEANFFLAIVRKEMSLGKSKFSMGDVIREFESGAKNGHIS